MTSVRLACVRLVAVAFTLIGITSFAGAQQAPAPPPQPAVPAQPTTPGQPAPGQPPVPGQPPAPGQPPTAPVEEGAPPTVERPAPERPTAVPEEVAPADGIGIRFPTLTIGDADLFLPPTPRGRLQITPSITLSGEYTDNIDRRASNERDEVILGIIPGISLTVLQPRYRIAAGYNTSAEFFLNDTRDNEIGQRHRLFADIAYQYDRRLSFSLFERFVFDRNTDVVTVSGLSTGDRDAFRNTITPGMRWQATPRTGLIASASYTLLRFDEEEGVRDGRDSDTFRVIVGADHQFTPRLTGTVDFGAAYFDIDEEPEAYTYTPRAGLIYQFTPRLSASVAAGPVLLQREGDLTTTPAVGAGLTHVYRWGSVQVAYDRAITAEGVGLADRQTVLAGVRVPALVRNLGVHLLGRYTIADIERESTDEDRDVVTVNLRLVYRITPTVSAFGAYTYLRQITDRADRDFDENRVFVGVQYAYPINLD